MNLVIKILVIGKTLSKSIWVRCQEVVQNQSDANGKWLNSDIKL